MRDDSGQDNRTSNTATQHGKTRFPMPLLWMVVSVILLIFSTYEIVERTWLTEASPQIIHFLHLTRAIGICIIVALLIMWYVLKTGPSIFPSEPLERGWELEDEYPEGARVVHFNGWFIRMRWLACIMGAFLVIVMIRFLRYLDEDAFLPLSISVVALVIINLIFSQMLKRKWLIGFLAEIQIGTDLILLTIMLHFSGGIENPMSLMYIFHVIIGGILLDWRKCYAIVFVACTLLGGLAYIEMSGYVKHYPLLVFPHGQEVRVVEPAEYTQLREMLGRAPDGNSGAHSSHYPLFVLSAVVMQSVFMALTAFFITTIMEELRWGEKYRQNVRQRLEHVVQATGAGLAILDRDLRPVWLNNQLRKWLNLSDNSNSSKILEKWSGGDQSSAALTLQDGKVRAVERALLGRDGDKRFFQTTIAPLMEQTGEVYQVVELTQDITERKILEAETIQAGKMASLGLMAAGIAHEVGNPLASSSARLRLLEEEPEREFVKKSIPLLMGQIDRISRIVKDISSFSRTVSYELSVCNVNSIILEVVTILKFHRSPYKIHIGTELADRIPEIRATKDQITSVFLNLGLNAFEAMEDRGGALSIKTYTMGDSIHIVFKDSGPGISEEVFPKLFTPFFTDKADGLGLGLCIVRKMLETHGGSIEVENHPEGGAIFSVILPVAEKRSAVFTSRGTKE
jgi:signal transduction histidine kinase